jgi:hypothetical protein
MLLKQTCQKRCHGKKQDTVLHDLHGTRAEGMVCNMTRMVRCTIRVGYDALDASPAYGTGKLQETLILLYGIDFL